MTAVLVDTSVWVGHFRHGNAALERPSMQNAVLCHPWVNLGHQSGADTDFPTGILNASFHTRRRDVKIKDSHSLKQSPAAPFSEPQSTSAVQDRPVS